MRHAWATSRAQRTAAVWGAPKVTRVGLEATSLECRRVYVYVYVGVGVCVCVYVYVYVCVCLCWGGVELKLK